MAVLALAFFGRVALRARVGRLSGGSGAGAAAAPAGVDSAGMSAAALLAECGRLAGRAAAWSEVAVALNPDADPAVASLLGRLRAARDGATPAVLDDVTSGCRAALADNVDASGFDALSTATRRSRWRSSARW
jgi:hypothetical protein